MEAFLLTLDVAFMILLAIAVRKVSISNKAEDLGVFTYHDPAINSNSNKKAKQEM
jgi:hypothetical protein